jgi:hypothetical protein
MADGENQSRNSIQSAVLQTGDGRLGGRYRYFFENSLFPSVAAAALGNIRRCKISILRRNLEGERISHSHKTKLIQPRLLSFRLFKISRETFPANLGCQ